MRHVSRYAWDAKKIGREQTPYRHTRGVTAKRRYPVGVNEPRDVRVVWVCPQNGGTAAAWAERLTRWANHAGGRGDVLKQEAVGEQNGRHQGIDGVYRTTLDGGRGDGHGDEHEVVIKCRVLRRRGDRLKAWLKMGRADRHRRGAAWLAQRGIETAAVLAQAYAVVDDPVTRKRCPVELLVMEYVEGRTLLKVMAAIAEGRPDAPTVQQQHDLARAISRQLIKFQDNGFYNRDHKPSNLIVRKDESDGKEEWRVVVIDVVALREPDSGSNGLSSMLASLVIEPIGCGCRPRRPLMMRTLYTVISQTMLGYSRQEKQQKLRRLWRDVQRRVQRHGDPRPKTNPLKPE